MLPFTEKILENWAGIHVLKSAKAAFERGAVVKASFEPPMLRGEVLADRTTVRTAARVLENGMCESHCPCRDNQERGLVCHHVVAVALAVLRRASNPEAQRRHAEEVRRAARLARHDEAAYIRRVPEGARGAEPATLRLTLPRGWAEAARRGRVPLRAALGYGGAYVPLDDVPRGKPFALTPRDENLLYVLEDISEGPARGALDVAAADFLNLLAILEGKPLLEEGGAALTVNRAPMASQVHLDLDRENGELILMIRTELPFLKPPEEPLYLAGAKAGWVYGARNFWPLQTVLPGPLRALYDKPVAIPRPAVPRFFDAELPALEKLIPVATEITRDLFTIEPGIPTFRLAVRGSPASLAAVLRAEYGGVSLPAAKPDPAGHFAHPDPDDLLRYTVRNPAAERAGLERLAALGLRGDAGDALAPIVGTRPVLNFLGRDLPALRRLGWKVDLEGPVAAQFAEARFVTPVVRIARPEAGDWFEVDFTFDDGGGGSISPADVQRALLKGEAYVERGGRTLLLDTRAYEDMQGVFADCASEDTDRPGGFRLAGVHAGYVKASLDALDGVDVEAAPAWLTAAERQIKPVAAADLRLDPSLAGLLRPYQRDGVAWLRFLEQNGFGGILADEMGLGKTVQTLAWIQMPRLGGARGPALIVCPTSLVDNWAEEARRFTPGLRVVTLQGADRHAKWKDLAHADLAVTSYALLRRDIDRLAPLAFSAVVLDEAQHIKNRSTQNAVAAKRIRADRRLVLTGTPLENSVADLWSIMDFLMVGYLGPYDQFRQRYEAPIAAGGDEGGAAQGRLRRKLQPFLLRRLKRDVARDLPPKIERIAHCTLSPDQQTVYKTLLEQSQRKLLDLVAAQGFARARMEVLKTLLRLRQVCCHLELLKLPDLKPAEPSAKTDLFFELVDEALDGGHRILVFSQFVTMLQILRAELDRRGLAYCYLDGSTPDRMRVVHTFNTDRTIPLFLISLKAGGSGLNLTGADMVIHYDPWWNPAVEDQATDRAHRIGQQRTVYAVKLITRDTVEEKVLALQRRKQAVIDATLQTDEQVMDKLSWEDVKELLAL